LKNDGVKVSWDDMTFPSEWKNVEIMFQSPPTSLPIENGEFPQHTVKNYPRNGMMSIRTPDHHGW
jgi:hypothetical protein